MNFFIKTQLEPIDWLAIRDLYEESFPIEERRPWELITSPEDEAFSLNALYSEDGGLVGFYTYWRLEHSLYYEHLAISPELRGSGLGQAVVELWSRETKLPLILEVELAETSDMATRRINFYRRNGLHLLPYDYIQPAYSRELPSVPMHVMCSEVLDTEHFGRVCAEIYRRVYKQQ